MWPFQSKVMMVDWFEINWGCFQFLFSFCFTNQCWWIAREGSSSFSFFTNLPAHFPLSASFSSESYDQFKQNVHSLFPVLIDTKNVTKDIWKVKNGITLSGDCAVHPGNT